MNKVTPLPLQLTVNSPGNLAAWSKESQEILYMLGHIFGALMDAEIKSSQHALMALALMAINAEDKGQSRSAGAISIMADGLTAWLNQPAPDVGLNQPVKPVRRTKRKQGSESTAVKPKK
ncbi:MAG: hypothetical protein ACOYB2_03045 [Limnohabitans sp.]